MFGNKKEIRWHLQTLSPQLCECYINANDFDGKNNESAKPISKFIQLKCGNDLLSLK